MKTATFVLLVLASIGAVAGAIKLLVAATGLALTALILAALAVSLMK